MVMEHWTSNENNIKFALRYDRVPIRESSTNSPAYIQADAGRALQAQEMKQRRFQFAAPGRPERTPFEDVVTPFMSGRLSVQESLKRQRDDAAAGAGQVPRQGGRPEALRLWPCGCRGAAVAG